MGAQVEGRGYQNQRGPWGRREVADGGIDGNSDAGADMQAEVIGVGGDCGEATQGKQCGLYM